MPFFLAAAVCCVPIAIAAVVAVRALRSRSNDGDEPERDLRDSEKPVSNSNPNLNPGEQQNQ